MTKITDLTGAAPDSADVIPYVDVSDTTEDAAGTAKKATVAQIVTAGNPGYLPKTAGSGEGVTGTLYLDPGSDDSALLLKVPVTTTDGADFNVNVKKTTFLTTEDVVVNWGFNNALGGQDDTAIHAWYFQSEHNYNDGGIQYAEYHLNLFTAGGAKNFRPFQWQYRIDGTEGLVVFKLTDFTIQSVDGDDTTLRIDNVGEAGKSIAITGQTIINAPDGSSSAFYIESGNGDVNIMVLDTTNNDISWRSRINYWYDTGGTLLMRLSDVAGSLNTYVATNVLPTANVRAFFVQGPAGHSSRLLELADNSGTVFAINYNGNIRTNQASANTATPSGATAYQLPIYNATGTLLGYIPVYGSAWT